MKPKVRRGITVWVDGDGNAVHHPDEFADMTTPVRCTCGAVYDLGTVTVTARYSDCSMWVTPCCKRQVDDRPAWGQTTPRAYTRLRGRP